MTCKSGLRMMVLMVVAAGLAAPGEALAVPARRLARRGVIVVAPVPAPPPAPVVAGPALRPRRMVLQPGPTAAAKPAATAAAQIPAPRPAPVQAAAGQPTVAAATASASATTAFTSGWYAKHPQAWRPAKAPADWWKTADVAAITAWLGQPVAAAGAAPDGAGAVTTAGGADVGADGLRSVLVLPAGHQNGAGEADADWLPLGVFAVVPPGVVQDAGESHNYQQLAVDKTGTIKGNFYDTISGTVQPITGAVDRTTLVASWTVGANGSRFTAPCRAFTTQPRTVSMSSDGQPRDLELMPVQRP